MGEEILRSLGPQEQNPRPGNQGFSPIRLVDLEIGQPIPGIPVEISQSGKPYLHARILVRLHGQPLGVLDFSLSPDGIRGDELAEAIWSEFSPEIRSHLEADGCPLTSYLTPSGVICAVQPACKAELAGFLAAAPPVSVVIATHNRTGSLAETLASLMRVAYPSFEIIVVDNAPATEETARFIQRNYPKAAVKYVREEYAGLAAAHNAGLVEVTAPYAVFTDDDVLLDRNWLAYLVKGFYTSGRVACVTGMIFPAEIETEAQEWIEQYGGFSKGFSSRIFDRDEHRIDSPLFPYAAGWFGSGASMAFRTDYLKSVGGFDPATGAGTPAQGGDDLSAFFQVVNTGSQLVYEPRSLLFHKHRREYQGLRRQAYGYGVGLTAYLTKTVLDRPSNLLAFAARLPTGLAYLLSSKSKKNRKKQTDYPGELNRLERQGMLFGPIAYLRSRSRAKKAGQYVFRDPSGSARREFAEFNPDERAD